MKIKEVEKLLQINSQTIRYYEKLGFLKPKRDENGYRNYTQEDVQILRKIHFLRDLDIPDYSHVKALVVADICTTSIA